MIDGQGALPSVPAILALSRSKINGQASSYALSVIGALGGG